jgi:type I restriction enzyme M protein
MVQMREQSEEGLIDAAMTHMVAFDASGVPQTLFSRIFAGILVLRWVDLAEAEQEAMAIFEERSYEQLLPSPLQWRHWAQLTDPIEMSDLMLELGLFLERKRDFSTNPVGAWLHLVVEPLIGARDLASGVLCRFVHWVADLPFETLAERRALRGVFDGVVSLTNSSPGDQYATPTNIANLVVALGNPRPGERVYDPCFGFGNLLLAAWDWASRSSDEMRVTGPLLDITGIDINSSAFLIGITRMVLTGIEAPHLEIGNSLERESPSSPNRQGFDLIVANPPFGGFENAAPWIQRQYPVPTKHCTGLFIQHVLQQLRPSGRAVLVVPDGFLFRGGSDRELRSRIVELGQVEAVVSLPAGAFLPYTSIKCSLILLNRRGGNTSVRMVDAASQFEKTSGQKAPFIRSVLAEQLAIEVRRPELRKVRELPAGISEDAPGTGRLARSIWEFDAEEVALADWDLSARRREKGGLDDLLSTLRETLGDSGTLAPLSDLVQVTAGRAIKSGDLLDSPPEDGPVGYVRITDLSQGKVGRSSSWLVPDKAIVERRWSLLPGDVLVSKSGTIGKSAIVRNGAVGSVASSGLYVLRADQTRLDPGFLLGYLNSPACQNWLKAQSVGIVIQHLNRPVLDKLPVPLPPLQLQARAAAQFRDFGTDVLAFLGQATGATEQDRLTTWLAELSDRTPLIAGTPNPTPPLSQLDPLAVLAINPKAWLSQEQIGVQAARWLAPLADTLLSLSGVSQIPAGPGLLMVLQEAERGFQSVLQIATGHLPAESQARATTERLRDWVRATIADLVSTGGLRILSAPASLISGSFAEFAVELQNNGVLPLRGIRVETLPDWGRAQMRYLAEHGAFAVNLRCDVPKIAEKLTVQMMWSASNLNGQEVSGRIELAIKVNNPEQTELSSTELGGSPYVTGSPLEPHHGHAVFFGREEVIGQIQRQIVSNGNVVLLEGNRRTGKTSILKHLEGGGIPGWLAVYSSLQGAGGSAKGVGVPTPEVFREIARSIVMALTKLGIDAPLPNGKVISAGQPPLGIARACREGIGNEAPFADFREFLETVLSLLAPKKLGLVLMLDEFDKLQEGIDNGVTSPQVPENIRFLIQTYPSFSAILTGSRRLKRLREEYWSALYGLGTSIPVTALDASSAKRMVTEPVRDKLIYSNEAIERIVNVTARHPYLLQCLCNKIFDYAVQTKNRSITLGIVNDAAFSLVRDNEHFASLWDYAGLGPVTGRRRRQLILLVCARNFKQDAHVSFASLREELSQAGVEVGEEVLAAALIYLRELELIDLSGEIGDGQYRLSIPLMADWIEQQQDADVVMSHARAEAEEEDA